MVEIQTGVETRMSNLLIEKTSEENVKKDIHISDAVKIISEFSNRFDVDLIGIMKKISDNKFQGFSINHNSPYAHIYIGSGLIDVVFEVMMKDSKIKLRISDDELGKWLK
jgi:hypothetical protein